MEVAAHVEAKARAAKEAAAALALAPTRAKNEALQQMARVVDGEGHPGARGQPRGSRPGAVGGADPRLARSPHPHRGADRGDGRRPPARGGAARPRRGDRRSLAATERRRDRARSRPPRRHRLHLRVAPQCHRGCRRALRQVRQCGVAAWRQRGARVQHDHRAHPGQGGREGGPAGRRHPVRRYARPRRRRPGLPAHGLPPPRRAWGRGGRRGSGEQRRRCLSSSTTKGFATSTSTRAPISRWRSPSS
jgi:hypothetical protein